MKTGGLTGLELLLALFIGLKLTHVIAWSWWWVLSPLWIPVIFLAGFGVALVVAYLIGERRK